MNRAIRSLPTPLSPVMRTLASHAAARVARTRTFRIAGLTSTIEEPPKAGSGRNASGRVAASATTAFRSKQDDVSRTRIGATYSLVIGPPRATAVPSCALVCASGKIGFETKAIRGEWPFEGSRDRPPMVADAKKIVCLMADFFRTGNGSMTDVQFGRWQIRNLQPSAGANFR